MAYGSGELGYVVAQTDEWLNEGYNGIDLFSSHNVMLAILVDRSQEPGGGYQFQESEVAEGNKFKTTVYGKVSWTFQGVTRANQVTGINHAINDDGTNAYWEWAHYEGMINHNYADKVKNKGKNKRIDLADMYVDQLSAKAFDVVGTDLLDGVVGTEDKIQSFNQALLNSATVGGIDQSDSVNNGWWQAQQDTTTEAFNTTMLDAVIAACTIDTGKKTGIRQYDPDVALFKGALWSKLKSELKPSQRQEVSLKLKGGAKYLDYDGCRCFRDTRGTDGTILVLNSTTWTFRYNTKMPEPVTPDFVPVSGKPSMWERGYNWYIGLGCYSPKHNAYISNKS
jgi:hypothetical protein